MSQRMLIESDPFETRVAVLDDGSLVETLVERHRSRGLVGNLYLGRVTRVLAGMQAAFVDVGLERDAFLYVDDAQPSVSRVVAESENGDRRPEAKPIQELVTEGQELLVQVAKDAMPKKGARVTTQVALPARFLVLLPGAEKVAVSRRIEDPRERERLATLISELHPPGGLIVRTAAESRSADEFTEDLLYLSRQWAKIEGRLVEASAPSLVHQDLEPALRMVRDLVDESFEKILVQDSETYDSLVGFLELVQPALAERVRLYKGEEQLFDSFGLEQQFDAALRSKVWLKSGGYLVINPTEALVAIDINTGRFTGGTDLEDTVFRTNLEAAREVVRQIRLRDLGGIIVVDFIDMEETAHGEAVLEELQSELAKDRARSKVLSLSDFGLVEITRKRSHTNLRGILTEPCPDCQGSGRVKSTTTLALAVRREILRERDRLAKREVLVTVHPTVAEALRGEERDVLALVEQEIGRGVQVRADDTLHREEFEVQAV